MKTMKFNIEGTSCESCAEIIKKQAKKLEGVKEIHVDLPSETAFVTYDENINNLDEIFKLIEEKGYKCSENKKKKSLGWLFTISGILIAGFFIFSLSEKISFPEISQKMGYGLLFLVGILTGFHCISMCGGFVVSYTAKDAEQKRSPTKSHLMYGAGKTLSYTLIGAVFGLLGSFIAFTPKLRGMIGVLAGIFLIVFGLKMLNIIPGLRKFGIRLPFLTKAISKNSHSGPLVIGLLNGLMIACGPLQAIYIMAAGTGSMIEGAKLLFIFGLGTLPVILGFGFLTSIISSKMTHKILRASGAVVIILGFIMLNNGLVLTGLGYDLKSIITPKAEINYASEKVPLLNNGFQEIRMDVTAGGWTPDTFVLKKGVPVRWIINGKQITNCNKAIQVPKMGLSFDIKQGEQVIEFTPTEEGVITWSCWMGMIPGKFIVQENTDNPEKIIQENASNSNVQPKGTCGMASGGGCGCGMMG